MPIYFKVMLTTTAAIAAMFSNDPAACWCIMLMIFWHKSQEDFT